MWIDAGRRSQALPYPQTCRSESLHTRNVSNNCSRAVKPGCCTNRVVHVKLVRIKASQQQRCHQMGTLRNLNRSWRYIGWPKHETPSSSSSVSSWRTGKSNRSQNYDSHPNSHGNVQVIVAPPLRIMNAALQTKQERPSVNAEHNPERSVVVQYHPRLHPSILQNLRSWELRVCQTLWS